MLWLTTRSYMTTVAFCTKTGIKRKNTSEEIGQPGKFISLLKFWPNLCKRQQARPLSRYFTIFPPMFKDFSVNLCVYSEGYCRKKWKSHRDLLQGLRPEADGEGEVEWVSCRVGGGGGSSTRSWGFWTHSSPQGKPAATWGSMRTAENILPEGQGQPEEAAGDSQTEGPQRRRAPKQTRE